MSEINITVPGGTTKRLLTAGKYCSSDILVTAEGGGGRLPEGYAELEYIESSGTQYVDTGIRVNATDTMRCDIVQTITPPSSGTLEGADCYMQIGLTPNGYGGVYRETALAPYGNKDAISVIFLNKVETVYINGTAIDSEDWNGTTISNVTLGLLKLGAANGSWYTSPAVAAKLYSCQIYDNGALVRDFVPCRNPYGVVGLYDLVDGMFYGNAGTGEFIGMPIRTLPVGYTKLDYIQSSGTQYIDTGLSISSSTYSKYRIVQEVLYPLGGSYYFVNGYSGSGVVYYFGCTPTGAVVYGNGTSDKATSYSTTANKKIIIDFNASGGMYTFDGNETALSLSAPSGTKNFFLFGYGNTSQLHTERLYSFRAYLGGVLVRDFVPCANASGVYGLYDMVHEKFYGNAGSGSFAGA